MVSPPDPNRAAPAESGLYGLDTPPEEAAAVVVPVPFDATTSYRRGAAGGPAAVRAASHQVELFDVAFGSPYRQGLAELAPDPPPRPL